MADDHNIASIERGRRAFAKDVKRVASSPYLIYVADHLLLRDSSGEVWAISVRSDGQLQTAKYPDGEPLTMQIWANRAIIDALEASAGSGLEVHGTDDT